MKMKYIIIHPSSSLPSNENTLSQQGYGYVFKKDGSVTKLKKPTGDTVFNLDTLPGTAMHIIYDGDGYSDDRTYSQYDAMEIFVKYHILIHPKIKIAGSYQIQETEEPGFEVSRWLKEIGEENNFYDA